MVRNITIDLFISKSVLFFEAIIEKDSRLEVLIIQNELYALVLNQTFDIVLLKYDFKVKYYLSSIIDHYKVQPVTRKFSQNFVIADNIILTLIF